MNPRYPQPQAAPVDGMTRQLQQLAALKGLGGHEQFQQQQLQQNDDASRMSAALHLLGLQQQGQEQQGREGFQNQQLALEGQRNQGEQAFRNTSLKNEQDYHQQQAKIQMFGELSRFPGMNMHNALNVSGFDDPTLATERAQAIERVYPMLKLVTDPNARETVGRAQLSQYPGAYEEALSKAFPQASPGTATTFSTTTPTLAPDLQSQTPLFSSGGIDARQGFRRNPALEAAYRLLYGGSAPSSPALDKVTELTGKDFTPQDFGYPN